MKTPAQSRWIAAGALAGLLLIGLAIPFWPQAAGGSTTYLVTRGTSMKPTFSSGDLALLRPSGSYRVGDLAGYRSYTLHRIVLHRIAAIDNGTYTFKGDANSFLDPERVQRSAIVGRMSVHIPKLGAVLGWLTRPFNAVLLALFVAMVVWNRDRLQALAAGNAAPEALPRPAQQTASSALPRLDGDRVVLIRDMSFPHELAVADVVDADSIIRLAERYDRPVLYDEAEQQLFVVESSMLFRCALAAVTPASVSVLSVVRDPEPVSEQVAPAVTVLPVAEPRPAVAVRPRVGDLIKEDRSARHGWPRRPVETRRRPNPQGRDWQYDRSRSV